MISPQFMLILTSKIPGGKKKRKLVKYRKLPVNVNLERGNTFDPVKSFI